MYTSRFTVVLLAAAVVIASCGKKAPSYTQYIPKDASYVVALDIKGMMTKLEKDSLSMENMLQVLKENKDQSTYNTALEYWKQFQNAGLDFENKLLVAIPALDLEKGEITAEVVAGLKDPKKLEEFIGKLPNSPKPVKEGNISTITTPDFSLGYNNEAVVILAKGGGTNQYSALDMEEADSNKVAPAPGASNSTADLLKKYFGLKKEESIASVEAATSVLAENADIAVYTSSASLANAAGMGGGGMAMAFMPKVKELVEGIYSTSLINFDDGKVDVKSNSFM
ncbi:MAG TPA: DUF4836 family protein, partial [Phnomibacter sp.]|nr:DUF4836 family protein [Phnomibacter sp.]